MRPVGKHTGERAAEVSSDDTGLPRRKILLLALGVTATLVAWGVLVYAAIDFGQEARSGEPTAWVLLAITTLGAAACLFVTLILGARILPLFQRGADRHLRLRRLSQLDLLGRRVGTGRFVSTNLAGGPARRPGSDLATP